MTEVQEPRVLETPKEKRILKISDMIILGILLIVSVVLVVTIVNRLNLKHEVNAAKATTDKVVAALAKQDTKTIRSYGDKSFQAKNTAETLNAHLTFRPEGSDPITFGAMYGDSKPTVSRQIVANTSTGQHVAIIYEYSKLKVPFYVRVDVTKAPNSDKWQLQALSASSTETSLET